MAWLVTEQDRNRNRWVVCTSYSHFSVGFVLSLLKSFSGNHVILSLCSSYRRKLDDSLRAKKDADSLVTARSIYSISSFHLRCIAVAHESEILNVPSCPTFLETLEKKLREKSFVNSFLASMFMFVGDKVLVSVIAIVVRCSYHDYTLTVLCCMRVLV